VTDPTVLAASFPHLSPEARTEVLDHYLGVTTWRRIVEEFSLPPELVALEEEGA